jgi:hypothetical protein
MLSRGAVLRLGAMTARAPSKNSEPTPVQHRPAPHSEMLSRSERSVGVDTLPHTSAPADQEYQLLNKESRRIATDADGNVLPT